MGKHEVNPSFLEELIENIQVSPKFVQVVLGPRQVGKSTGVLQLLDEYSKPSLYTSADEVIAPSESWIIEKWQQAVAKNENCLLVIDEIQKVPNWSAAVKRLWDDQARKKNRLKLILLGSSSLHLQTGFEESLSGRFQLTRARHWNFLKSKELSNLDVETFIRCGGYPGSYELLSKSGKWQLYIQDSIIDTVIGKDILSFSKVRKPALFRQAFSLLSGYPAQEMSYNKLLGQIQESGNTDLVKHYIELFESAFLIKALFKYSPKTVIHRSSSPKILPLCGALIDRSILKTQEGYGRAVESAVGSALIDAGYELFYWRNGRSEVDFVVEHENAIVPIEVKSGRTKPIKGMRDFTKDFAKARPVFINAGSIESFLLNPRKFISKLVE